MTNESLLLLGGWGTLGSIFGLVFSAIGAVTAGWRAHVRRTWVEWEAYQIEQAHETAIKIDAVIEDLHTLDRKVHYRHNIHCPKCGRFSRQAEGWPAGVSHCATHGLGTRTLTGGIPIVLTTTSSITIPTPEPVNLMIEQ